MSILLAKYTGHISVLLAGLIQQQLGPLPGRINEPQRTRIGSPRDGSLSHALNLVVAEIQEPRPGPLVWARIWASLVRTGTGTRQTEQYSSPAQQASRQDSLELRRGSWALFGARSGETSSTHELGISRQITLQFRPETAARPAPPSVTVTG